MKSKITIRNDLERWEEYRPVPSAESISIAQNREIERIDKLDAGENVYGPSPLVTQRLSQFRGYQFYPDSEYRSLRKEISNYSQVNIENIFVSNGGDELIDLILRLVLNKGDEVIDCPPTFSSYSLSTVLNGGIVKVIKRKDDFSINTEQILKSINIKTKVVYICSPNNPTGNITSITEIEKILLTGVLVCVDEAYIEFGGQSSASLLNKYENLVIIRSLSKWAGIAGLRLGYGLMSKYLVRQLMKIKAPYNVNCAAIIAGIASLQDKEYRELTLNMIRRERQRLIDEIQKLEKYTIFPSGGNFVYVLTTEGQQKNIRKECDLKKISIRFFDSNATKCAIRITIGTRRQNKKVVSVFKKYL